MINCIIVDDEPLALDILESHISQFSELKLVRRCGNALEAFNALHQERIDLAFLDIQMPLVTGIDFVRSLRNPPMVIFTTAYANHALTGFELDAVDYLLKPVTFDRFKQSMAKLLRLMPEEPAATKNYTYFKVAGNLVKIEHEDLLIVKSVKDYLHLQTRQGNYLTHMTMKNLVALLPAGQFARVHRSYMVNRHAVTLIGRRHVEVAGERVPIGENYSFELLKES